VGVFEEEGAVLPDEAGEQVGGGEFQPFRGVLLSLRLAEDLDPACGEALLLVFTFVH
jgi:hypothetical protein